MMSDLLAGFTNGEGKNMESVRKKADLLGRIKWLGLLLGLLMYYATAYAFGDIVSTILACIAATVFYVMCENERKSIVSRHVSDHLSEALTKIGQTESVFEVKTANMGMIIRVYLIRAGERAPACTKAVLDADCGPGPAGRNSGSTESTQRRTFERSQKEQRLKS